MYLNTCRCILMIQITAQMTTCMSRSTPRQSYTAARVHHGTHAHQDAKATYVAYTVHTNESTQPILWTLLLANAHQNLRTICHAHTQLHPTSCMNAKYHYYYYYYSCAFVHHQISVRYTFTQNTYFNRIIMRYCCTTDRQTDRQGMILKKQNLQLVKNIIIKSWKKVSFWQG